MSLKPSIKEPCPADWNKMKIGVNSRFCKSCSKHVVDFTEKSRDEILEYLLLHYGEKTCGHFYRSQLDYWNGDFELEIQNIITRQREPKISIQILIAASILLSSCGNHQMESTTKAAISLPINQSESDHYLNIEQLSFTEDSNLIEEYIVEDDSYIEGEVVMGMVGFQESPQFPGGNDSLKSYLANQLDLSKNDSLSGKVYVSFTIGEDGKTSDIKIERGFNRKVDEKIKSVISSMPPWIPALSNGKPIRSRAIIPIVFKPE